MGKIRVYPTHFEIQIEPQELIAMPFVWDAPGPGPVGHAITQAARQKLSETRYADTLFSKARVRFHENHYVVELKIKE